MIKTALTLAATLTLSACISQPAPQPFNWQKFVLPLDNNEYLTDVQSPNKNRAGEIALKAAYGACTGSRPIFLSQTITRTGTMGETTSDLYNIARNAAATLGEWSPNLDNTEYTAAYKFKCYTEKPPI